MRGFSSRLDRRETALLAGATAFIIAATTLVPLVSLLSRGRFSVWCRQMASQMMRFDVAALVITGVAAISACIAQASVVVEIWTASRLRRALARSSMPLPGKVLAALAAIGAAEARVRVVRDLRPYAYAFGVREPNVVVSSGLVSSFSREELKAVLRHELHHLASHDTLRALSWEIACRAFFFLPALGDLAEHFTLAREIAADRHALDSHGRRVLASALLKATAPGISGVAGFVPFGHLRGRIDALAGERGTPLRIGTLRAAVSAMAIVSTMVAAVPAHADASPVPLGLCRAELDRQIGAFIAPFSRAFPPGPSSAITDVQSREIGPY